MTKKYRSGESGKYISKDAAETNKATSVSETDKKFTVSDAVLMFGENLKTNPRLYDNFRQMWTRRTHEVLTENSLGDLQEVSGLVADVILRTFTGDEKEMPGDLYL